MNACLMMISANLLSSIKEVCLVSKFESFFHREGADITFQLLCDEKLINTRRTLTFLCGLEHYEKSVCGHSESNWLLLE
jgi:hypothetical protein